MIKAMWKYRKIIFQRAYHDLATRYAGSNLGIIWNLINPLVQILIFTFVFSEIMLAKMPGMESKSAFAMYLCSGLLPWMAFSEGITRANNALLENATYLKKLPTPETVFVAQVITSSYLAGGISLTVLFIINIILGGNISPTWLAVPIIFTVLMVFGLGLGLVFSTLNVFFKDIGQVLGILLQVWMWVTPIVYAKEILPQKYLRIVELNPLYWFIEPLQGAIVYGKWPGLQNWGLMLLFATIAVLAGTLVLTKLQAEIRDVI